MAIIGAIQDQNWWKCIKLLFCLFSNFVQLYYAINFHMSGNKYFECYECHVVFHSFLVVKTTTFHVKRNITQTYIFSFFMLSRIHFSTWSEIPNGLTTFHAKQSLMQSYTCISSFLIELPTCRVRNTLPPRIFFNAKQDFTWINNFPYKARFHMSLQSISRGIYVKIA